MRKTLPSSLLSRIIIETPCHESWSAMTGDDRKRHCASCRKDVYNLSEMTEQEALTLLHAGKPVCMRLFRRPDGTVLTKECGTGMRKRWQVRAMATAALFALLAPFGLRRAQAEEREMGRAGPDFHEIAGGISLPPDRMVMGDVALPTPTPNPPTVPQEEPPKDE